LLYLFLAFKAGLIFNKMEEVKRTQELCDEVLSVQMGN
jgi:hypothetical protein